MEHLSNDHNNCLSEHDGHKLYDETGHLVLNLMENEWKLRQQLKH